MEGAGDDIPDGWTAKVSRSSGQAYYVNRFTNESQWEKPTKPAQKPSSEKVQVNITDCYSRKEPIVIVFTICFFIRRI